MKTDKSFIIRTATESDAKELLSIYAPYVENTAITFEYEVPSCEEFKERIRKTLENHPYLAAIEGNEILGYAYASPFKNRAAYNWSAETSIYLKESARGRGIGRALYTALEEILRKQNIINLNACIVYPHPQSEAFHERMGYQRVAHFTKCGYKLGQWHDMIWMEKMIAEHPDSPDAVIPFSALAD